MKQSNSFHQVESFADFDYEQSLRRFAAKRQAKGIKHIPFADTQNWLYLTDLDEAVEQLEKQFQLEIQSCH